MELPRKGDVWLVNFDLTCGKEIQKKRPAVVVSRDEYNAFAWPVLVVPLTSQGLDEVTPVFEVPVPRGEGGTEHDSKTKVTHMRTVDRSRLLGAPATSATRSCTLSNKPSATSSTWRDRNGV